MIRTNTKPWFYLDISLTIGHCLLPETIVRHIKAKRLRPGNEIILFNNTNKVALATIVNADSVEIINVTAQTAHKQTINISLPYSDPKITSNCLIKSAELGCDTIYITHTDYGYSNGWHKRIANKHIEKWNKLLIQACQQCENPFIPKIILDNKLKDLLNLDYEHVILGFCKKTTNFTKKSTLLYVGPEGGFSPNELLLFNQHDALCLNLGNTVLRIETAATAGLATIKYIKNF